MIELLLLLRKTFHHVTFDFTRDKEILQLRSERINLMKYMNVKIYLYIQDQEESVPPTNSLDYLSLLGDNADKIPG